MKKNNETYHKAQQELDILLAEIESEDQINFDLIAGKVKRAAELLNICKKCLHDLDKELEEILNQID